MKNIEYDFFKIASSKYNEDINNKLYEEKIKKFGIEKVCVDESIINNIPNTFNIELPSLNIYDQGDSERCWICAGINLIKNNVVRNLDIVENDFKISVNYLSFLDKLEKSNSLYNRIIETKKLDFNKEIKDGYLEFKLCEGGYFSFFKALVNKYGIVPESIMPEVSCSFNSLELRKVFREKVKKDICKLLKLKKEKNSKDKLYNVKNQFLIENYNILSKCLGEIPIMFDFEYTNKSGDDVKLVNITPQEFSKKYLTVDLDNFISIGNFPFYNKKYYKVYRKNKIENVYENSYVDFLNLPIDDLKTFAIKQLKDGVPVWVGMELRKMRDRQLGILDTNLYHYKNVFFYDQLTKEEALSLYEIDFEHCMVITGVQIENDIPVKWKIEDSYGTGVHQNGYYIMNDNYFNEYVFEILINKKYLSLKQLDLLKQKPILMNANEPF